MDHRPSSPSKFHRGWGGSWEWRYVPGNNKAQLFSFILTPPCPPNLCRVQFWDPKRYRHLCSSAGGSSDLQEIFFVDKLCLGFLLWHASIYTLFATVLSSSDHCSMLGRKRRRRRKKFDIPFYLMALRNVQLPTGIHRQPIRPRTH